MPKDLKGKLVIAISSRALFNLDDSHHIYQENGVEAYASYQIDHENDILSPGVAFPLVKKLLALNPEEGEHEDLRVEVILLSRNSADTGLRIFNAIEHYGLGMTRAAFCGGESPYKYVQAFGAHLFLSADPDDVRHALNAGCAAAMIYPGFTEANRQDQLRIAFDGDSVLFSDEAERIYQEQGLDAFTEQEKKAARQPLRGGPLKPFLSALHGLQSRYSEEDCPIRTALITARSAPAHERVIRTLRAWKIRIDEAIFLGGLSKGEFLRAFGADFFFDDQTSHCESAANQSVASGHVPHGVTNQKTEKEQE